MHQSLFDKILPLNDGFLIYPGHGYLHGFVENPLARSGHDNVVGYLSEGLDI